MNIKDRILVITIYSIWTTILIIQTKYLHDLNNNKIISSSSLQKLKMVTIVNIVILTLVAFNELIGEYNNVFGIILFTLIASQIYLFIMIQRGGQYKKSINVVNIIFNYMSIVFLCIGIIVYCYQLYEKRNIFRLAGGWGKSH